MESGVGRAMIAKLAKDNPDKKIAWIAVSEGSVKSYNKFVEEYPDLINRIEFENKVNTDEIIDSIENNSYNSQKGVNNAEGSNQGNIGRGSKTDTSRESSTSNSQIQADMEGKVPRTGDESSLYRGVSESVSTVNERGKNTVDINKPIQNVAETDIKLTTQENNLKQWVERPDINEASIKTIINHEAYGDELAEFNDVRIQKMTPEEIEVGIIEGYTNPAQVIISDDGGIIIKVDATRSAEEVEFNILHEIGHLKQSPEVQNELNVLASTQKTQADFENYYNHPYEIEADEYAENLFKKKKAYNEKNNKTNDDSLENRSQTEGVNNNEGNSSIRIRESEESRIHSGRTDTTTDLSQNE